MALLLLAPIEEPKNAGLVCIPSGRRPIRSRIQEEQNVRLGNLTQLFLVNSERKSVKHLLVAYDIKIAASLGSLRFKECLDNIRYSVLLRAFIVHIIIFHFIMLTDTLI